MEDTLPDSKRLVGWCDPDILLILCPFASPALTGGIGKNFYEIIRSSREFVEGMESGRERGEERMGDISPAGEMGYSHTLARGIR